MTPSDSRNKPSPPTSRSLSTSPPGCPTSSRPTTRSSTKRPRRWTEPDGSCRRSSPAQSASRHSDRAADGEQRAARARPRSQMKLLVNGADVEVDDRHAKTPLLWVLRDVLGLHGTKFGCGAGLCAACTVLVDGRNAKACQTATERAVGKTVTTVEGASGPVVDAVRDAWHRGNVVQCGYCQPGQTLAAVALLESDTAPDDAKIDSWMSGNLCRCGTYPRSRAAVHAAAETLGAARYPDPLVAPPVPEVQRLMPEEMADP